MKKIILFFGLVMGNSFCQIQAQTLSDFQYFGSNMYERTGIGFSYSATNGSNNEAPHPALHRMHHWSVKVDIKTMSCEKGGKRYYIQYKLLGDVLTVLTNQIHGSGNYINRQVGSSLSNGLFGWHSFGKNVIATDRFCLALGGNLNDYFIGNTYDTDSGRVSLEPQGYYFAAGPTLFADFLVNKHILIQTNTSYSLSFWRATSLSYGIRDDSYPKPHFFSTNIELVSTKGFFVGFDYNWIINRGNIPGNVKRWDYLVGFRFML